MPELKITQQHLEHDAYLYIRQSTPRQVVENTESTQRQYALRDRAVALGWPLERIHVLDCDLGKSGSQSAGRDGFQKLVSEVAFGKAGLVMGLEVSRLARNSADWHRLIELFQGTAKQNVCLADSMRIGIFAELAASGVECLASDVQRLAGIVECQLDFSQAEQRHHVGHRRRVAALSNRALELSASCREVPLRGCILALGDCHHEHERVIGCVVGGQHSFGTLDEVSRTRQRSGLERERGAADEAEA